MADTKISAETAASALDGTELFEGVQSAANVKVTGAQIKTLAVGTPAAGKVLAGATPDFTATPTLGVAGATKGTLALAGNTSGTVTVQPAAAAGTWSMTLPTSGGTNTHFLQTNGSGVTTWAAASATPAGADTTIQYNNAGAFGATNLLYTTGSLATASGAFAIDAGGGSAINLNWVNGGNVQMNSNNFALFGSASLLGRGGSGNQIIFGNAGLYGWSSGTDGATGLDTGLTRVAAGLAEVNNGTPGTRTGTFPIKSGGETRVSTQFDKTSNTTLGNITGLSSTVVSGRTYSFEAVLFTSSNVAGGVQAAIAGTATATAIIYQGETINSTTLGANDRATALGTSVGGVTTVTVAVINIYGTITVNAGGTLTVQFAQNASNGATSSVLVGSYFRVWDTT